MNTQPYIGAPSKKKGITMLELIVAMGILTLMSTAVLISYSGFNDTLILRSHAEEASLLLREAQVYSIGSLQTSDALFVKGYGVHFDKNGGQENSITFFADKNENKSYDVGTGCGTGSTECEKKFFLKPNYSVSEICGKPPAAPLDCSLNTLDAVFTRPALSASLDNNAYSYSRVTFSSPGGKTIQMFVWASGHMYVE